jgi:hypothetical protein
MSKNNDSWIFQKVLYFLSPKKKILKIFFDEKFNI